MRVDVLSIFPAYLDALDLSLPGKARRSGLLDLHVHDLRDWTHDRHRTVDDAPYGGGAGMILRPEPVAAALDALRGPDTTVILLDPVGEVFSHARAADLAARAHLVFLCPRYEGVDERIRALVDLELSIGDYVLSGGEVPALAVIDAVARLVPGVVGDDQSVEADSFTRGLLDYPHYTRPADFRGMQVPEVLLNGNHAEIEKWRRQKALEKTQKFRQDLLNKENG